MKHGILLLFGACALLCLPCCSDERPTTTPGADVPRAPETPAATSTTPPVPATAPSSAAAPQDAAAKPLPRGRVDAAFVKAMFTRDPSTEEVDNPVTPEKVALGRALYHDASLSADGARSCASCHPLDGYGIDGKPTIPAAPGVEHARNVPTTWNAFRQFRQGWDGRAATIEDFALAHALAADGNALGDDAALVAKVTAKPELAALFTAAFPGGGAVTAANVRLALGAFLRTLVTKSKWDAYLDGDAKALGNDAVYGLQEFIRVGCTTCHATRLVGGNMMQKTGLLKSYESKDPGRMAVTGSEADKSFFKVPSLLNVEKTAPYMHDGKFTSLEQMVTLMADIQLDKKLTPEQVRGIVAFLKALTGPLPAGDAAPAGK